MIIVIGGAGKNKGSAANSMLHIRSSEENTAL